jgi:hypothetical protein
MKLTKLIIIIALIIVLILLLIKINDNNNNNKKEHLKNMNESILNMISLHTDNGAILNTAKFNRVNAEQLDVFNNMNANKGTFNNITVNNNIDISNNLTANTGNIRNINVLNNLTGTTGSFKNIISTDISNNNITAESGIFRTVTSESINIQRYDISSLNINKICFDRTDITKCLTLNTFNGLNNLNNYNVNNPKNQYMYYPNSVPGVDMSANIPGTYNNNIIWNTLRNYIEISPTTPLNENNGKLRVFGSGESWIYYKAPTTPTTPTSTTAVTYTGLATQSEATLFRTSTFKNAQSSGVGIEITVPKSPPNNPTGDYSVLWIKCTNSHAIWYTFKLYHYDSGSDTVIKTFGKFADGYNSLNKFSPDGSMHNDNWQTQQWVPIPFDLSGNSLRKLLLSNFYAQDKDFYISSIAFSTNPWNHCKVSAKAIFWQINNDDNSQGKTEATGGLTWNSDNWQNQPLAQFNAGNLHQFRIPFVNSGKDKIFYLVEHNSNWGPTIIGLSIVKYNGTNGDVVIQLGNFYTSFDNPFARHYNSKLSQRYYGIVIPKEHLPTKGSSSDNFLRLVITLPGGNNVVFTEVGTHDKNSFD